MARGGGGGGTAGSGDDEAFLTPVVPGAVPAPPDSSARVAPEPSAAHEITSDDSGLVEDLDSIRIPDSAENPRKRRTIRQRVYLLLDDPDSSCPARTLSHFMLYTIVMSILGFILDTVPELQGSLFWVVVDYASTSIFTLEYILRLWTCNASGETTRWEWVQKPMNVLDLLSLMPTDLLNSIPALKPFRVLRAARLIRIFRVFKLSKYSNGMNLMVEALYNSARPLWILGFFLGNGVVLFSSMLYYAEKAGCPDIATKVVDTEAWEAYRRECNMEMPLDPGWTLNRELCCTEYGVPDSFQSIPATFWWTIVTMTTVGYGDKVPRTLLGQLVGGMAMISGIMLISLPVAIVGSKFQQAYELSEAKKQQKALEEAALAAGEKPPERKMERTLTKEATEEQILEKAAGLLRKGGTSAFGGHDRGGGGKRSDQQQSTEQRLGPLKAKLLELESKRRMSMKAQSQIALLMELFEHIEEVEKKMAALQDKDATVDVCIRSHFTSLSRSYNDELKAHAAANGS